MASLSQAKTLGGVGSILALLGIVPSVGPVLSIAGLIMSLVAVKYVSDILRDKPIFNNMIITSILTIGGIVRLVAFFSLPDKPPMPPSGTAPASMTTTG